MLILLDLFAEQHAFSGTGSIPIHERTDRPVNPSLTATERLLAIVRPTGCREGA